jgi:hypothetical protein
MTSLETMRAEISRRWDDNPAVPISIRILEFLAEAPEEELQMLTFYSLSKIAQTDGIDDLLIQAVGLLSNSSISAIEVQLVFIDDEEEYFPISKTEYATAKEIGFLPHPETGEQLHDFQNAVIATFTPTEEMKLARLANA